MPRKNKILWVWRDSDTRVSVTPAKPNDLGIDYQEAYGWRYRDNDEIGVCPHVFGKALGFLPTETPERIRLSVERLDR